MNLELTRTQSAALALLLNVAMGLGFVTRRKGGRESLLAMLLFGTTGVALAMPPGEPRLPGATGKPAPRYEVRVVDEDGVVRRVPMLVEYEGGLYEALCCPDPCYEPRWLAVADAAFTCEAARPVTQQRAQQ